MTDANQPIERSSRSRSIAALVLVAVTTASVMAGIAIDRLVLTPKAVDSRPGFGERSGFSGRPGRGGRGGPGGPSRGREPSWEMRRRFSDQMTKDLDLTPSQQVRVDSVLTRQMEAIRRATDAVRPTTDSITREAQKAMDAILTPSQRAKVKVFRERTGSPRGGRPTSQP